MRLLGYAENSILHVNQFKDTINGRLCCAKTVPDSTKVCLIKVQNQNFLGEHIPGSPGLPHALHTDTYLPPSPAPNTPYNLLPPNSLGKKLNETLPPVNLGCYSFKFSNLGV